MALFRLGSIHIAPGAEAALNATRGSPDAFLARHQAGDWGIVDDNTRRGNEFAVQHGHTNFLITSRYLLEEGVDLVIMTGEDQSWTRLQLPTEHEIQKTSVQAGYAMIASTYDQDRNPLIAVEALHVDALISPMRIDSALDVGTGTGRHALNLARRGVKVTAVDQSPEMLEVAEKTAQREGLTIDFRHADIEGGLGGESSQYDFVMCALMLSHVADLSRIAREFYRVLRPGGAVLITDLHPNVVQIGWGSSVTRPGVTYFIESQGHTRHDYLASVTAAGFDVDKVIDIPFSAIPDDYRLGSEDQKFSDYQFCLILLAKKPLGAPPRS